MGLGCKPADELLKCLLLEEGVFLFVEGWSLLVEFRQFKMNGPKGVDQRRFQMLPRWRCLSSCTSYQVHSDCSNAVQLIEHLICLTHRRRCWSTPALSRCPDVDNTRASAAAILVGFVCYKDVDQFLFPLSASCHCEEW